MEHNTKIRITLNEAEERSMELYEELISYAERNYLPIGEYLSSFAIQEVFFPSPHHGRFRATSSTHTDRPTEDLDVDMEDEIQKEEEENKV